MNKRRYPVAGLAALAVVGLVSGCAGNDAGTDPTSSGDGGTIEVGVVISLSGPGATYGIPGEQTLRLLASEYNDAGGSPQVNLTIVDDESQAAKAITAARSLISSGADIILGGSISAVGVPLAETLQAENVPYIATAVDQRITEPTPGIVNPSVFQTPESQGFNISAMLDYVEAEGLDRVAMIFDGTALGQGAADTLQVLADERGIEVVASEVIEPEAGTAVPQLVKSRDAGADALLVYAGHATAPVVQLDFADMGWDVPILQSSEALSTSFREAAGDAAVGTIVPSVRYSVGELLPEGDPQREQILAWNETADAELGGAEVEQIYCWDAWAILEEGLKGLKPVDSDGSQEELRAAFVENVSAITDLVGLVGIRTFTPSDHRGLAVDGTMTLVRLTDDGLELVEE